MFATNKKTQLFCSKCLCPDGAITLKPPYKNENINLTYCSVCLDLHHYGPKLNCNYFLKKIKEFSSGNYFFLEKDFKYSAPIFGNNLSFFDLEIKNLVCKYYLKPIDLKIKDQIWKEIILLRTIHEKE